MYCVTATDPCGTVPASVCFNVTVIPEPNASFTSMLDSSNICAPELYNFDNDSVGLNTYLWNFADGGTDTVVDPAYVFHRKWFVYR